MKEEKNKIPKVSVVIPCYNLGKYLHEAIDSVLHQTEKSVEIIVVDDGSTDVETIAILDALRYPNVRMIRTHNQGLSSARNTGVGMACAEYVCCLDADDVLEETYLQKAVSVLDKDAEKKVGFVTPWVKLFEGARGVWRTSEYDPVSLALENGVAVASLFRKMAWEEVGGYAVNMRDGYEDWNFWVSLVARGYRWEVLREPLFFYRVRKGSMITKSRLKHTSLYNQLMKNNREFFQQNMQEMVRRISRRKSKMQRRGRYIQLFLYGFREARHHGIRSFFGRLKKYIQSGTKASDTKIVIGDWYAQRQRGEKKVYEREDGYEKKSASIVYILPGTSISGGVAIVLQHANRLMKMGYDVKLLSQDGKSSIDWFPEQAVPIIPFREEFLFLLGDVDVLIATSWTTAPFLDILSAKRKIYFVQSDERRFNPENMAEIRSITETYKMDIEFMTEAKWIQRWLKEEFGKSAYYVPNGLDEKIFFREEGLDEGALLFSTPSVPQTGHLPLSEKGEGTRKENTSSPSASGTRHLLATASRGRRKIRVLLEGPIDCWFKGMGDAYNAVKDLDCEIWIVSSNGKPKEGWRYDRFFENVPYDKMREVYASCDVFLKMSRIEGFFGPPMEAMACGCAVVVGEVTGFDEYIVDGENALVVKMGDIEGAKRAVSKLLEDKDLRQRLIEGGYKTSREWNWNRSMDLLEKVIFGEEPTVFYTEDSPRKYDYKEEMRELRMKNAK